MKRRNESDIIADVSSSCLTIQDGVFPRANDLHHFKTATTRTARDINRRLVLNLIRKHQPISRADLARRSRLQRSTVSLIVEQLIAERWVAIGAMGDLPRGRKPTYLHLNGNRAGIIGIDIRPAATLIALADLDMRFLAQTSMRTHRNASQFTRELGAEVVRLMKSNPNVVFEGIGVALPGRVQMPSCRLTFAPNMSWDSLEIKKPLEAATGLPVELENAANACALAEIWSGHHPESVRNLIAVTVSEGIGMGMILNGQLVRGTSGMAGEFGHITVQENGPLCNCGNRGCFEVCASNTAAVRYFSESRHPGGKSWRKVDFDFVLSMAEQQDAHACRALDRMARALGVGLTMIVTGLAPDVIVVAGEVPRAWKRIGPVINEAVRRGSPTKAGTRIVPGDSDAHPRLRGAIALVLQKHFGPMHPI